MASFESVVIKRRNELEFGDIILIRRKAPHWMGWAVQVLTTETYAHSAMYVGSGIIIEADPKEGVFTLELDFYKCDKMTVLRKKGGLSGAEKISIMFQMSLALGRPYDRAALAFMAFHFILERLGFVDRSVWRKENDPYDDPFKFYCHQLIAFLYRRIGITHDLSEDIVLASDFRNCPKLEVRMSDYDRP